MTDLGHVVIALNMPIPEGHRYPEPDPREQPDLESVVLEILDVSVLWMPSRAVRVGDRRVDLELFCDEQGHPLLAAYTSLDELRAGCGPQQPAAAIGVQHVGLVADEAGAHGVVFNAVVDEQARRTEPVVDWSRRTYFH